MYKATLPNLEVQIAFQEDKKNVLVLKHVKI